MAWKIIFAASLLALPVATANAQDTKETDVEVVERMVDRDGNVVERTSSNVSEDKAEKMLSDCPGRVFQTSVMVEDADGKKNARKIKICGESDDAAAWIELMQKAKEQVIRMEGLDAESRTSLLDDFDAEIERTERDNG